MRNLRQMRGAVAAGHPLTAAAGARVLEAGGNAVDACVAAACVSWVCESPLTGPGGGGFMLIHASEGISELVDFFVTVPGAPAGDGDLRRLEIDFDGDTQQVFQTGPAAVAVPGTALGLEAAHRSFGSLPWAELVAPAARLAREGVELTPAQGYLHRILDGLLRHSPEGDAMYRGATTGRCARATGSSSRISPTRSTGSPPRARRLCTAASSRGGSSSTCRPAAAG